jgi:hypothetical protein
VPKRRETTEKEHEMRELEMRDLKECEEQVRLALDWVHPNRIWILTAATQEQYDLLFKPPNWRDFWKPSFAVPTKADIDAMLDELDREEEQSQASDRAE